jgi:acyl-CoA dehydrogenase
MSDRELILETADSIFGDACAPHIVRGVEGSWLPGLWDTLEELGFTRIGVSEDAEGSGGDFGDAVAVVRVGATHAAPIPLAETLIAAQVAAAAGFALPPGPATIAAGGPLQLKRLGAGVRVDGRLPSVPWGAVSEHLVVIADEPSSVLVIDLADCDVVAAVNLAGEPHADIVIGLEVEDARVYDLPPGWSEARLDLTAAVYRAAQIAGALDTICSLTIAYTSERHQFKRPIGAFQAIQHHAAVLTGIATAAKVASDAAASTPESALAVASAKAYIGHASGPATMIAHQVHGAIGFTAEYQLQLFTRRIWSWRDEFGNDAYWATRLGNDLCDVGPARAWDLLSAR